MSDKYVAYVGSYTYIGKSKGITIFDVDLESGTLTRKGEIPCNNSSFMAISHSGKYLSHVHVAVHHGGHRLLQLRYPVRQQQLYAHQQYKDAAANSQLEKPPLFYGTHSS